MNQMKLIVLLTVAILFIGCQSHSRIESRNMATHHRYWKELVNKGDLSKHHELITPDFTLYFGEEPIEPRGFEVFKTENPAFSKIDIVEDESLIDGNRMATRWHGIAIHDRGPYKEYEVIPGEKEVVFQGMAFYQFDENGLISEVRILNNMDEVFKQRAEQARKTTDQD